LQNRAEQSMKMRPDAHQIRTKCFPCVRGFAPRPAHGRPFVGRGADLSGQHSCPFCDGPAGRARQTARVSVLCIAVGLPVAERDDFTVL
jgi:hypothetical protein